MHSYILFPLFSQDNRIIFSRYWNFVFPWYSIINLISWENKIIVQAIKSFQKTSFSVAMSDPQEHIDRCIRYLFNQGLTQAEIALCLGITDNLHISVHNLKRRLARLQLYRRHNLSELDICVNDMAVKYIHILGKQTHHLEKIMPLSWENSSSYFEIITPDIDRTNEINL